MISETSPSSSILTLCLLFDFPVTCCLVSKLLFAKGKGQAIYHTQFSKVMHCQVSNQTPYWIRCKANSQYIQLWKFWLADLIIPTVPTNSHFGSWINHASSAVLSRTVFLEPKTVYLKALLYYIGDCWIYRVKSTSRDLAHLSSYNLAFVPDWPDFNTSSPFDVSSQQQGEDIYVQIKTHIKRYINKEITYQNFIFNPRENPFLFGTYFCLVCIYSL